MKADPARITRSSLIFSSGLALALLLITQLPVAVHSQTCTNCYNSGVDSSWTWPQNTRVRE